MPERGPLASMANPEDTLATLKISAPLDLIREHMSRQHGEWRHFNIGSL